METIKQQALDAINHLPDNAKCEDIMYTLYIIDGINKGLKDVEQGNVVSHEDIKKEFLK